MLARGPYEYKDVWCRVETSLMLAKSQLFYVLPHTYLPLLITDGRLSCVRREIVASMPFLTSRHASNI